MITKYHCGSLVQAFDLLNKTKKSVDITIEPAEYTLVSSHILESLQDVKIMGSAIESAPVIITCKQENDSTETGVVFIRVRNLVTQGIHIKHCSIAYVSSSQAFSSKQFVYFRTVIYCQNSTNLYMKNIKVYNNNGIEMAIIDPDGIINITYSEFRNNSLMMKVACQESGLSSHTLNVTNSINCIKVSQLQCDSEGSIALTNSKFSVTCNLTSGKQPHNSSQVLSFYRYTNGDVIIDGMATQTCNLQLKTGNNHQVSSTIMANFSKCTPGYIFDDQRQQCDCIHAKLSGNPVILKCDPSHLQAYVNPAFWVGFKTSNTTVLTASPCPFGYCYGSGLFRNGIPLTQEANKTILDQQVCGAVLRTGRLCGKCIENYSVAVNSPEFLCKNCKHHPFGMLFFILSYIIPVTVLFYLIMTYNIRVTSGLFGAFMFIAQILGSEINFTFNYRINAATRGELEFSKILFSLYSIFNLELFRHDMFSYCLFENVGTVDILAFTLFASLYPLGLIMVYSLVRTYCSSHCLHHCLRHCRIANRAVTSGLSAFLVFCFAKINVLAFAILKQVDVAYIDSDDRWKNYMKVVYLQGNLEYFGSTHMMYAIGALTILIAIIAFPTVLLLFHPLILSLLGNLGLGESRLMKCIDCCLRINKLRPLLDSFQGNYKNSMKFFAALHFFLYRTLVLCAIIATPTSSIGTVQLILIALFFIILLIHIVTSPFKNQVDNIAHSVVYILIIVKLGMLYLFITDEGFPFLTYLGTALSSLPLLILVGYILWMLLQYICIKVLMLKTRHNGYVNLDNDPED